MLCSTLDFSGSHKLRYPIINFDTGRDSSYANN